MKREERRAERVVLSFVVLSSSSSRTRASHRTGDTQQEERPRPRIGARRLRPPHTYRLRASGRGGSRSRQPGAGGSSRPPRGVRREAEAFPGENIAVPSPRLALLAPRVLAARAYEGSRGSPTCRDALRAHLARRCRGRAARAVARFRDAVRFFFAPPRDSPGDGVFRDELQRHSPASVQAHLVRAAERELRDALGVRGLASLPSSTVAGAPLPASSARANAPCQGPISKDPPGARRTCAFARTVVGGVPGATPNAVLASSTTSSSPSFSFRFDAPISRQHPCSTSSASPAPCVSERGPWRCAKRAGRPPGTILASSASGTSTLLPKTLRVVGALCRGVRWESVSRSTLREKRRLPKGGRTDAEDYRRGCHAHDLLPRDRGSRS